MKPFYVLNWSFNSRKLEHYDVMPHFMRVYQEYHDVRPKTYDEFKQFIISEGKYHFWARCEYEIIVTEWPYPKDDPLKNAVKIDVWDQIEMNLDTVTRIFMENVDEFISSTNHNDSE